MRTSEPNRTWARYLLRAAGAFPLVMWIGIGCTSSTPSPAGNAACTVASDCGPNPAAACARVCKDGSNPCTFACVAGACVDRGCAEDDGGVGDASTHDAAADVVTSDAAHADASDDVAVADGSSVIACNDAGECGPNPGASCAHVCADGSNPCTYACVSGACVERGCPTGDGGTCEPGEILVKDQAVGGGSPAPDDAGGCPSGMSIVPEAPGRCSPAATYHCAPRPAACASDLASAVSCQCAGDAACTGNFNQCLSASGDTVTCVFPMP